MEAGHVIANMTVQHVTWDDYLKPDIKEQINEFNKKVEEHLDDMHHRNPDVGAFFLEDEDVDEDPIAHGDGTNTPTAEEYGEFLEEDRPDRDD